MPCNTSPILGCCKDISGCARCGQIGVRVDETNFVQSNVWNENGVPVGPVQYHRTGSLTHPSNPFQSFVSSTNYWGSTLSIVDGNGTPVGISSKQIVDRAGSSFGPNSIDQGFTFTLGPAVDLYLLGLEAHSLLAALDFNGTPIVAPSMRNPPSAGGDRQTGPCINVYNNPQPLGPPFYTNATIGGGACAISGTVHRQFGGVSSYAYKGITSNRTRVLAGVYRANSCLVSYAGPLTNGLIVLDNAYVTGITPLVFNSRVFYDVPLPVLAGVEMFTANVFDEFCQINPFV
jgi:hypothetical protein